jgi:hypothetical protein
MGNLRACFAIALLALAACGSDHAKDIDASIKIPDAAIDAKVFEDAPPPSYDLSCLNGTGPTTAPATVSIAGTTSQLSMNGGMALPNIPVAVYNSASPATAIGSATSDAAGTFTINNIPTGTMPLDGFLKATDPAQTPTLRTSYLYPPSKVAMNLTGVPVTMVSEQTFGLIQQIGGQQDDTMNGAFVVIVTDCMNMPIKEADITVKQNNADVGSIINLGQLAAQAAGTFFVLNVPDGSAVVTATYNNMAFPARTLVAHKKPNGNGTVGTITQTAIRPGV